MKAAVHGGEEVNKMKVNSYWRRTLEDKMEGERECRAREMRLQRGLENKSQSAAVLGAPLAWPPTPVGSGAAVWATQIARRALPLAARRELVWGLMAVGASLFLPGSWYNPLYSPIHQFNASPGKGFHWFLMSCPSIHMGITWQPWSIFQILLFLSWTTSPTHMVDHHLHTAWCMHGVAQQSGIHPTSHWHHHFQGAPAIKRAANCQHGCSCTLAKSTQK